MVEDNVTNVLTDAKSKKVIEYTKEQKKEAFLKFLNWVLVKLEKEPIDEITDFKDIKKRDLETINTEDTVSDWSLILFPIFDKKKMQFYMKKYIKHYIITLIKYGAESVEKTLKGKKKKKQVNAYVIYSYDYYIV